MNQIRIRLTREADEGLDMLKEHTGISSLNELINTLLLDAIGAIKDNNNELPKQNPTGRGHHIQS